MNSDNELSDGIEPHYGRARFPRSTANEAIQRAHRNDGRTERWRGIPMRIPLAWGHELRQDVSSNALISTGCFALRRSLCSTPDEFT